MTMHLTRTHQNRWIARLPRSRASAGIITRLNPGEAPSVFRAEARTPFSDERRLLQGSDTLEIAFARIIASHTRAGAATNITPEADEMEPGSESEQAA